MNSVKPLLAVLFLLACGSTAASAQLKSVILGKLTYIGESVDGTSFFTVTLDSTDSGKITVPLATPITFISFTTAIVGQTGSRGPIVDTIDRITTPTEVLFGTDNVADGGHPCPCLAVAVQLVMSTAPTVTLTLKNGETITTSSIVNVDLVPLHGQQAIQLQQFAYIILHAVQ